MTLDDILTVSLKKQASDAHLKAGLVPVIRKHGRLRPLAANIPQLSPQQVEQMAMSIMDEEQKAHFQKFKEIDLGYSVPGTGRFRVNIFQQRGSLRMVVRNIPFQVPTITDLNLPEIVNKITELERGLVLITGVTGSGKSSTMAAIIDAINATRNKHILTIEDPIEFLIRDRKSIISQRELGVDTTSFAKALRAALRQDPDVILIGEMRDKETIETALVAAETGHLVLSTLHTLDAQETISRILSVYEPHQREQVRLQLAGVLKAVVSQRLARRKDKSGFVPAVEILLNNARTRDLIADAQKSKDIRVVIEDSKESTGMQSFDQSLFDLVSSDLIDYEEALRLSTNPEDFALRYSGVSSGDDQWNNENTQMATRMSDEWSRMSSLEIDKSKGEGEE